MGGWVRQHKKSCDMSILGFLIVGISKIISIFLLGYPRTPQDRLQAPGGSKLGGLSPNYKKSYDMSIIGFFNSGDLKYDLYFSLG